MFELLAVTITSTGIAAGVSSVVAATVLVGSFAAFWVRIGRWQQRAEDRYHALAKLTAERDTAIHEKLDSALDSISDAHDRIDGILGLDRQRRPRRPRYRRRARP